MKKLTLDAVWFSGLLALVLFFIFRKPADRFDPVIAAEGIGYYSYLPALFFHHNLNWEQVSKLAEPHYKRDIRSDFVNAVDGREVNKYFPGVSFLMVPFFILAWLTCLLIQQAPDGYGPVFQYYIGLSSIFYTVLGLHFTRLLINRYFSLSSIGQWTGVCIFWGTNLLYNSVFNSAQSHAYSFFATAGFLYFFSLFYGSQRRASALPWLGLMGAIGICIRPTFVLILFFLPVLYKRAVLDLVRLPLQSSRLMLIAGLFALFPVLLTLVFWKIQTESFLPEAYKGEYFNFMRPHVVEMLFSFRKGWFTYHPILLLIFPAILMLWVRGNKREAIWSLIFLSFSVYVFSCWWIWTYAVPFGQRVFIDFYPAVAFLMAGFFVSIRQAALARYVLVPLLALLCVFNGFRTWQYFKGIIPWEYVDSRVFFETIPLTYPRSWYLVNEQRILERRAINRLALKASPGKPDTLIWSPDSPPRGPLLHFRLSGRMTFSHSNSGSKVIFLVYNNDSLVEQCERYCNFFSKKEASVDTQLGFEMPAEKSLFNRIAVVLDPGMETVHFTDATLECLQENPVKEFIESNGRK